MLSNVVSSTKPRIQSCSPTKTQRNDLMFIINYSNWSESRMPKKRHGHAKIGPGRAGLLKELPVGGPLKTNISK